MQYSYAQLVLLLDIAACVLTCMCVKLWPENQNKELKDTKMLCKADGESLVR